MSPNTVPIIFVKEGGNVMLRNGKLAGRNIHDFKEVDNAICSSDFKIVAVSLLVVRPWLNF